MLGFLKHIQIANMINLKFFRSFKILVDKSKVSDGLYRDYLKIRSFWHSIIASRLGYCKLQFIQVSGL